VSPLCQVFFSHDDPDIPRYSRLEIDIDDYAIMVEFDVLPTAWSQFRRHGISLVQHSDDSPVHAAAAGLDHGPDLVGSEESGGRFCHGVLPGSLELSQFLFGDDGILVLDEPEVKLFQNRHVIADRILLERPPPEIQTALQGRHSGVEIGDGIFRELVDKAPPSKQGEA